MFQRGHISWNVDRICGLNVFCGKINLGSSKMPRGYTWISGSYSFWIVYMWCFFLSKKLYTIPSRFFSIFFLNFFYKLKYDCSCSCQCIPMIPHKRISRYSLMHTLKFQKKKNIWIFFVFLIFSSYNNHLILNVFTLL